jgi:hypothetical protein
MARHGRPGKHLTLDGIPIRNCDIAKLTGLSDACVWSRLQRGWTPEEIVARPERVPFTESWRCRRTSPGIGQDRFLAHEDDLAETTRRDLLDRARRHDPEALAELRGVGLLTWQTAREGVIL